MATTAAITISSDIGMGASVSKSMTLTKAGALTDIEETTGFSRRRLASTAAVDIVTMADASLLLETSDNTSAKVFIQNVGDGKGNISKDTYVTISVGDTAGTTQQIGRLHGGDWLMMPVTVVDGEDIEVRPQTDDVVILEYAMFYEEG